MNYLYRRSILGFVKIMAFASIVTGVAISSTGAGAVDISVDLARAQDVYKTSRSDAAALQQSIVNLRSLVTTADSPEQKYDAQLILSWSLYYQGTQLPSTNAGNDRRKAVFGEGLHVAEACIALGKQALNDERAECYFLKAINLGRWAEANGIPSSLGERYNLRNAAFDTMYFRTSPDDAKEAEFRKDAEGKPVVRHTKEGRPGMEFDGFGAYRVLGRMYHKLPWPFLGLQGDKARAERILRDAVAHAPNHSLNVLYLAYVLIDRGNKDEAKRILDTLLANNPDTFNLDRLPETRDEFREARTLRASLGN